jgi:hypothetical protein
MGIEIVRRSEFPAVAESVQADIDTAQPSVLIHSLSPVVWEDDPNPPRGREPTWFRVQFLGLADDCSPQALGTVDLRAAEASTAMREAICMGWPPEAIGFRLLDLRRTAGG